MLTFKEPMKTSILCSSRILVTLIFLHVVPKGMEPLPYQEEGIDFVSLNLPKTTKAWKLKDTFTLPEHQICLLGKSYIKYEHNLANSKSRMLGSGLLGVHNHLLKDPTKPQREERSDFEIETYYFWMSSKAHYST